MYEIPATSIIVTYEKKIVKHLNGIFNYHYNWFYNGRRPCKAQYVNEVCRIFRNDWNSFYTRFIYLRYNYIYSKKVLKVRNLTSGGGLESMIATNSLLKTQ